MVDNFGVRQSFSLHNRLGPEREEREQFRFRSLCICLQFFLRFLLFLRIDLTALVFQCFKLHASFYEGLDHFEALSKDDELERGRLDAQNLLFLPAERQNGQNHVDVEAQNGDVECPIHQTPDRTSVEVQRIMPAQVNSLDPLKEVPVFAKAPILQLRINSAQ